MSRPKGSKNKPKDPNASIKPRKPRVSKTKEPEIPALSASKTLDAEAPVKPKKEKDPNEETGPLYMPINMQNFIFTEHMLERYAKFVLSQMDHAISTKIAKRAEDGNVTHAIIRKMLAAVDFSDEQITSLLKEVEEFKQKSKPEQLYLKIKRR